MHPPLFVRLPCSGYEQGRGLPNADRAYTVFGCTPCPRWEEVSNRSGSYGLLSLASITPGSDSIGKTPGRCSGGAVTSCQCCCWQQRGHGVRAKDSHVTPGQVMTLADEGTGRENTFGLRHIRSYTIHFILLRSGPKPFLPHVLQERSVRNRVNVIGIVYPVHPDKGKAHISYFQDVRLPFV
jgi:hypothetical protein